MTEAEWLASADPEKMLDFLKGKASPRKWRLFACVIARRITSLQKSKAILHAIETGERYADGLASELERVLVHGEIQLLVEDFVSKQDFEQAGVVIYAKRSVARTEDEVVRLDYHFCTWELVDTQGVQDIFGNPFRPVTIDPNCLTFDVLALARQMYESRDYSAMPILADALQDAGCDNVDILTHCRGNGPHVRGCFVVDLILGKS